MIDDKTPVVILGAGGFASVVTEILGENASVLVIGCTDKALGLSERSLARGLSGEGTTYTELRDERRQALAIERLERGERIDDVASALGFSDASSFSRAFRRWTGRSPGSYRAAG